MKAVQCTEFGSVDDLSISDIEPAPLKDGEVRIRVRACGINFPDMLIVSGQHQMKPPLPFVPGGEVAGNVSAVGPGVADLKPGDSVVAVTYLGGLAEYVNAPRGAVHPWPSGMPVEQAAAFNGVYATAYHALKQRAGLQAGETLLVLGAAGGVGLAAVQLGLAMGARVIAGAGSEVKTRFLRAGGAHDVVNYGADNLRDELRSLAGRRGVDVVCDPVGGNLFDQAARCMAWNGRLLVLGFASGLIPDFPVNLGLLKGASVVGVNYGRFVEEQPDDAAHNIRELLGMYADGQLDPHVSRVFPMSEAAAAMHCLKNREAIGKIVVTVSPD